MIEIGKLHASITPVGSRVTCNPAPTNTDRDWLVLVPKSEWDNFAISLHGDGWGFDGSDIPLPPEDDPERHWGFNSFSRGEDNVIATASPEFHRRFLAASSIAKRLNLLDKSDRIALFQAVLYGNEELHPGVFGS